MLSRIRNFPVSFFSVIMGLAGTTISLQKAIDIINLPEIISFAGLAVTLFIFSIISIAYTLKIFTSPKDVIHEFNHPVKVHFFPTISISLLLLSIATSSIYPSISQYLCYIGAWLHLTFMLSIIHIWMHEKNRFQIHHMNPSWFIPAVGNILVPIAWVHHLSSEINWFFFSIWIFFWGILLTIFFYRIIFHESITERMTPTLFILIAPPALAFISYFKLTGVLNDISRILFSFGIFITILVFSQIKIFLKIKNYYLSLWAYSFPLAAMSIATALMYHETSIPFYKGMYIFLLSILAFVILFLIMKTLFAIKNRTICVEE